jgi:hypothetical protein
MDIQVMTIDQLGRILEQAEMKKFLYEFFYLMILPLVIEMDTNKYQVRFVVAVVVVVVVAAVVVEVVTDMMIVDDSFLFESLLVLELFYNLMIVDSKMVLFENNLLVLIYLYQSKKKD